MSVDASQQIDRNHKTVNSNEAFITSKTLTFDGTAVGDVGTDALFTVTGAVLLNIIGVCTEDLAGATATLEVGVSGNTAALLAQTTATDIDNGEVWVDTAPATVETLPSVKVIGGGQDIIATTATAAITDGTITFYCLWRPLNSTSKIVAA